MKFFPYVRWTDHPHFTGDVWNVHDLWLMYGTYVSNSRCMEHSGFSVDVQDMNSPWKTVRTSKLTKHRQQLPMCDWN